MNRIFFENNGRIDYYINNSRTNLSEVLEIENYWEKYNYEFLEKENYHEKYDYNFIEIGPKKNFKTSFSQNVINLLNRIGIDDLDIFEHIKVYNINNSYNIDNMLEEEYNSKKEYNSVSCYPEIIDLNSLHEIEKYGIFFDNYEFNLYSDLYKQLNRNPYFLELYDLCQSNSEHSRHWFFKGQLILDNIPLKDSLFRLVKSTLSKDSNSLVAFSDNSSVIKGYNINRLTRTNNGISFKPTNMNIVLTAETHNFPTLICPFEGANTGVGGRIRDNHATGKGAYLIASLAGYCVGDICVNYHDNFNIKRFGYNNPLNILIDASNGASDYGNKIGEPIIGGFTRSFGMNFRTKIIEWVKPIMFSAGIGCINDTHNFKNSPCKDMLIIRIGGPAYKIGLGGGFSSSLNQNNNRKDLDYSAVQRGDPQMGNKLNRVINCLIDLDDKNPIISIHDQGAGGLANVVKEIVYPCGGEIDLKNVTLGDNTMTSLEIWCSEFQESDVLLIDSKNIDLIKNICKRENICCDVLGKVTDTKKIIVKHNDKLVLDLPLEEILEPDIRKEYILSEKDLTYYKTKDEIDSNLEKCIRQVLNHTDVGSKRFLTNKVDRSVTGLIAQQQCVGPFHTPISNYSLVSLGYFDYQGIASAIGEKPILGLLSPESQGSMSVGEMITNMMGVYIENISNIKCSANWMWALKTKGESTKVYLTALEMVKAMKQLEIGIDGGKDSLSMSVSNNNRTIDSPGSLVITGYASCPNIYKKVTPELKSTESSIIFIDLANGKQRLGASVLLRANNKLGKYAPRVEDYNLVKKCFNLIQSLILNDSILSLHDRSDGGLISTLAEMSISSNIGLNLNIDTLDLISYLFNEELGIVIEIDNKDLNKITDKLNKLDIPNYLIGNTVKNNKIQINEYEFNIKDLSLNWEINSYKIDKIQTNKKCIEREYTDYIRFKKTDYYLPDFISKFCYNSPISRMTINSNLFVGIIRDEGSNGDKEMLSVFSYCGFSVLDIHMNDLIQNPKIINKLRGIVYVGGFSHSDVLGAAHGWYLTIKNHPEISRELDIFMNRKDTFSLGVCNGCQLMVKQNIFDSKLKLIKNVSNRFESRFSTVKIYDDNNIFFKNMKGMIFGIWVAHGEGNFKNTQSLSLNQKVMKYHTVLDSSNMKYPQNPNGSEDGLAGVCSKNGRHLAMMPHPERCFLKWQLPYLDSYKNINISPWLLMFKNIYDWCNSI